MFDKNRFFVCKQCCQISYEFECCEGTVCNGGGCKECFNLNLDADWECPLFLIQELIEYLSGLEPKDYVLKALDFYKQIMSERISYENSISNP